MALAFAIFQQCTKYNSGTYNEYSMTVRISPAWNSTDEILPWGMSESTWTIGQVPHLLNTHQSLAEKDCSVTRWSLLLVEAEAQANIASKMATRGATWRDVITWQKYFLKNVDHESFYLILSSQKIENKKINNKSDSPLRKFSRNSPRNN